VNRRVIKLAELAGTVLLLLALALLWAVGSLRDLLGGANDTNSSPPKSNYERDNHDE